MRPPFPSLPTGLWETVSHPFPRPRTGRGGGGEAAGVEDVLARLARAPRLAQEEVAVPEEARGAPIRYDALRVYTECPGFMSKLPGCIASPVHHAKDDHKPSPSMGKHFWRAFPCVEQFQIISPVLIKQSYKHVVAQLINDTAQISLTIDLRQDLAIE